MADFFRNQQNKILTLEDRMEFINLWFIVIVASDALTIIGSGFKIFIEAGVSLQRIRWLSDMTPSLLIKIYIIF